MLQQHNTVIHYSRVQTCPHAKELRLFLELRNNLSRKRFLVLIIIHEVLAGNSPDLQHVTQSPQPLNHGCSLSRQQ